MNVVAVVALVQTYVGSVPTTSQIFQIQVREELLSIPCMHESAAVNARGDSHKVYEVMQVGAVE